MVFEKIYIFLLAYGKKLCYYHKAITICPHGQAVQDVALSRRKLGFDSLWGYQMKKAHLNDVLFRFYKRVLGIERAEKLIVRWTVSPPRRDNKHKNSKARDSSICAVFAKLQIKLICIAQT